MEKELEWSLKSSTEAVRMEALEETLSSGERGATEGSVESDDRIAKKTTDLSGDAHNSNKDSTLDSDCASLVPSVTEGIITAGSMTPTLAAALLTQQLPPLREEGDGGDTFDEWSERLELLADLYKWEDSIKLAHSVMCLEGQA